ncbi:hypothetical protein [Microbispora sp. NPDC046933]|uniref:hypothetical protein n=1 Tax=Microbispora sp. NPDC046933 TaxID=3155618 RepID=UPI0033DF6BA1
MTSRHAEVEQVWPRDGRVLVIGRIVDAALTPPARTTAILTLTNRDRPDLVLSCPATVDGGRFRAAFPIELVVSAVACREIGGRQVWDLHLRLPGDPEPLRVGRHLDDIRDKKKVMTFPAQTSEAPAGAVSVKPYYTVMRNLSLISRPVHS